MKRKALLIGNTRGLQGVPLDLKKMNAFLRSNSGGAWLPSEIEEIRNPKKKDLLEKFDLLKNSAIDYSVVLFTGHGAHQRNTILELNGNETIREDEVLFLSTRQLSIFDCCRVVQETVIKSAALEEHANLLDAVNTSIIRKKFEDRVMQAIPHQSRLYGCSIGQCSYDSSQGAIYLNNLLAAATNISSDQDFKTIGEAHEEAVKKTVEQTRKLPDFKLHGPQIPDSCLPKCLTRQQLVISLR